MFFYLRGNCIEQVLRDVLCNPADRIIIAAAITIGAPVVTKDEKILDYPYVTSIW